MPKRVNQLGAEGRKGGDRNLMLFAIEEQRAIMSILKDVFAISFGSLLQQTKTTKTTIKRISRSSLGPWDYASI
jgi:hypothetical protein